MTLTALLSWGLWPIPVPFPSVPAGLLGSLRMSDHTTPDSLWAVSVSKAATTVVTPFYHEKNQLTVPTLSDQWFLVLWVLSPSVSSVKLLGLIRVISAGIAESLVLHELRLTFISRLYTTPTSSSIAFLSSLACLPGPKVGVCRSGCHSSWELHLGCQQRSSSPPQSFTPQEVQSPILHISLDREKRKFYRTWRALIGRSLPLVRSLSRLDTRPDQPLLLRRSASTHSILNLTC